MEKIIAEKIVVRIIFLKSRQVCSKNTIFAHLTQVQKKIYEEQIYHISYPGTHRFAG